MKRPVKSNLHIIIPTLCLILLISVAMLLSIDKQEGREISYDFSVTAEGGTVLSVGYERDGSTLKPKDGSAYLVLPVTNEKINDVRIIFGEPLDSDCEIRLSYVSKNGGQSVDNSITTTVKNGALEYFCTLPYDTYTVLECHIPAEIEIESVVLSHVLSSTPVYARKLNTSLLIWMLVPVFCAYFAAMGVIFVKRKRK